MNRVKLGVLILVLAILSQGAAIAHGAPRTIDNLTASYSDEVGLVTVSGIVTGDDLTSQVVIEIYTPEDVLLFFGTAAVDEERGFSISIAVGSLALGTYTVKSAYYEGGSYATATFQVPEASETDPVTSDPVQEPSAPPAAQSPDVTMSPGLTTSTTSVPGAVEAGHVTYQVSQGQVQSAVAAAQNAQGGDSGALAIQIVGQGSTDLRSSEARLTRGTLDALDSGGVSQLTVSTPVASISFDSGALDSFFEADLEELSIAAALLDDEFLPEGARAVVGDRPVYQFSVSGDSQEIVEFGGTVSIAIPYVLGPDEESEAVVIYYLNARGELEIVSDCVYDAEQGTVTFRTSHLSTYAVGHNAVQFQDVPEDAWYRSAVTFAAARAITTGTSEGFFSPEDSVTRAQFLVMVMRAYGIAPQTAHDADNFEDAGDTYYTGFLATAKTLGIAEGVGVNCFNPEGEITRQEMFVFLHRALGAIGRRPVKVADKAPEFADAGLVEPWASEAIEALAGAGMILGDGTNLYPNGRATRAETVQMIQRLLAQK